MRPEVLDYELLVKARRVIEDPTHWLQNGWHRGDRHCAVDALLVATGATSKVMLRTKPVYKLLAAAVPKLYIPPCGDIQKVEQYNDARTTTHAKIMKLYDRAIARAKALATR